MKSACAGTMLEFKVEKDEKILNENFTPCKIFY